jgi:hypothetical protein
MPAARVARLKGVDSPGFGGRIKSIMLFSFDDFIAMFRSASLNEGPLRVKLRINGALCATSALRLIVLQCAVLDGFF